MKTKQLASGFFLLATGCGLFSPKETTVVSVEKPPLIVASTPTTENSETGGAKVPLFTLGGHYDVPLHKFGKDEMLLSAAVSFADNLADLPGQVYDNDPNQEAATSIDVLKSNIHPEVRIISENGLLYSSIIDNKVWGDATYLKNISANAHNDYLWSVSLRKVAQSSAHRDIDQTLLANVRNNPANAGKKLFFIDVATLIQFDAQSFHKVAADGKVEGMAFGMDAGIFSEANDQEHTPLILIHYVPIETLPKVVQKSADDGLLPADFAKVVGNYESKRAQNDNIASVLHHDQRFSSFDHDVALAGLEDTLAVPSFFVVLAPTNNAISRLPGRLKMEWTSDQDFGRTHELVLRHIYVPEFRESLDLPKALPFDLRGHHNDDNDEQERFIHRNEKIKELQFMSEKTMADGNRIDPLELEQIHIAGQPIACSNGIIIPIDTVIKRNDEAQ